MTVQYIHPTPVYSCFIDNLQDVYLEIEEKINGVKFEKLDKWGGTHYLSDSTFSSNIIEEKKINLLRDQIIFHAKKFCKEINCTEISDFEMYSSWVSLFTKGDYGHIHNHSYSDISGVYYHKTNGIDGKIFFEAANSHLITSKCFTHLSDWFLHDPKPGKLILFPGWLRHGIQTNNTNEHRISLSFNLRAI